MALRSRYREKIPADEISAPSAPVDDERIQPSETTHIEFTNNKADPSVGIVTDEIPQPDEATLTLQKQIADLKKSEELQRQYALHVAAARAQPPTREQKLAMWRQQGADEGDLEFLEQNPAMVDMHDLTRAASGEAEQQGHERGTPEHREATRAIFHQHLQAQQAQPARPAAADPAGFFQPPERRHVAPEPASPSALYSAPVSRTAPSGGPSELSPRQVRLSPAEQQIARASGISDVQYAEGKLRMLKAKAAGELQ